MIGNCDHHCLVTVIDLAFVAIAALVSFRTKKTESFLLMMFFATSAASSYFIFKTDAYVMWPMIFTALIVIFGTISYNHIVIIGYIMHLIIVGLNQLYDVIGYSTYIYGIFALQLLAVTYGHNIHYYWDIVFGSKAKKARFRGKPG